MTWPTAWRRYGQGAGHRRRAVDVRRACRQSREVCPVLRSRVVLSPIAALAVVVAARTVGMPVGEGSKVFEPFSGSFERGSGLGLAIVYRIVKDYNGVIQVDSVASQGTEISVHFPLDRRTIG